MEQLCRSLNKRTCFTSGNCLLVILIIVAFFFYPSQSSAQSSDNNPFTIVIDAGHGGKDPGAVGKKSYEKNIALSIALKLGYYIESLMPDVRVMYTRKTDVFIDLDVRADIANKANADLFLSIHVDGFASQHPYGTSTYVMGITKNKINLELAQKENKVIEFEEGYIQKYQGYDPNDPASLIQFTLQQSLYEKQSLEMAAMVQDQFRSRAKRRDRGVHPAPLLVLWQTTVPSVLIETGFITNPREEEFLNTVYGQDLLASAIFRAFKDYKIEYEARTASNDISGPDEFSLNTSSSRKTEAAALKAAEKKRETLKPSKEIPKKEKESVPLKTKEEETTIKDNPPVKATQSKNGLEFRVQVMASQNRIPINSKAFKGYTTFEEIREGIYFKYISIAKSSYSESSVVRKQLLKSFPGAFIVAFRNGKKIPLREAIKEDKKIH
ncbi:MAG: N-acetylmuramoyl-L-alanine amidase [Bacteroidota bacterium]|nr:N-acetylmuramoyl-L-alanine amidase [Bacteroidota bacterium]